MIMWRKAILRILSALCLVQPALADSLRLYIDGDYSVAAQGAEAIELGLRAALDESDNQAGGYRIEVLAQDTRLNVRRTERLYQTFAADPQALAVFGGVYSPSYLAMRETINAEGLLTLLPWSAAGPITRPADGEDNYLFRLSVDDWKAGPFLVEHAIDHLACDAIGLVTTDTGWGRSNQTTITSSMEDRQRSLAFDIVFADDLGAASAAEIAQTISDSGADCMILVAGMPAGALMLSNLADMPTMPRVISHWGILTGAFTEVVTQPQRERLSLQVLQTCGLEAQQDRPELFRAALSRAGGEGATLRTINDIPANTGFVHGYDLGRILLAAIDQAVAATDFAALSAAERRQAVKAALESLDRPVEGLLKTYDRPFAPMTEGADAHEALGAEDLCMAKFDGDALAPADPG